MADRNFNVGILVGVQDKASSVLQKIGFNSVALGTLVADGVKAAGRAIGDFVKGSVDAYGIQEKANVMLAQSMRTAGIYTDEAYESAKRYASELQTLTEYGDETIQMVQKSLIAFGAQGDELNGLTKATLDLSTATGMDLKAAGDLVGKSIGSSTNALSRYGVEIEGAVGSTTRMASAINNISKLYGGAAEASASTYAGQMKQLSNRIGDIQEKLGMILVPIIKNFVKILNTSLLPALENVTNNADNLNKTTLSIAKVIKFLTNIVQGIVFTFQNFGQVIATVGGALYKFLMHDYKGAIDVVTIGMDELGNMIMRQGEEMKMLNVDIDAVMAVTKEKITETAEQSVAMIDIITAAVKGSSAAMTTAFKGFFTYGNAGFMKMGMLAKGLAGAMKDSFINALAKMMSDYLIYHTMIMIGTKKEIAAKTISAYAGIPFIGLALALGAIGAMMSALEQFATGGIVGGNSFSGDNNIVRANSGEMILTKSQQARLFSIANGAGAGGGNIYITGNYILDDNMASSLADKVSEVILGRVQNEVNI